MGVQFKETLEKAKNVDSQNDGHRYLLLSKLQAAPARKIFSFRNMARKHTILPKTLFLIFRNILLFYVDI